MSSTIEIEGIECQALSVYKTGIKPGEMYLARRNADWKLLTCAMYHPYNPATCNQHYQQAEKARSNHEDARPFMCGLVWPQEKWQYPFDDYECFKVVGA